MEDEAEVGDGEGPDGQERWRMRHRFGSHEMVRIMDERRRLNRR